MSRSGVGMRTHWTLLGLVNLWGVGGAGILIALAGSPFIGSILILASLAILVLTLTGRIQRQRTTTAGSLVVVAVGIIILFFSLLGLGVIIPANLKLLWYGYLAVFAVLSVAAVLATIRASRSPDQLL